jgi:SAM-dependent methyltransferase
MNIHSLVQKLLAVIKFKIPIPYPLGRIAFWISVLIKRVNLLRGGWSQRAVEYPWVLNQLKILAPRGARVLDVGCSESVLSHELLARGHEVWGIDINDYPYKPRCMMFIKQDVRNTDLQSNFFDAIICVSTIEHVGLPVYGQVGMDLDADVRVMREFHRILKPGGYLILTTPFAGREFRLVPGERQYDSRRLQLLVQDFELIRKEVFIPYKLGRRTMWIKLSEDVANKIDTSPGTPALLCLIVRKPSKLKVHSNPLKDIPSLSQMDVP